MSRFGKSVQQRNCSLASLDYSCKISDLLAKQNFGFMLGNFSFTVMHLERNGRTYHICISLAYSKGKIRRKVHKHCILVVIMKLYTIGGKFEGEAHNILGDMHVQN